MRLIWVHANNFEADIAESTKRYAQANKLLALMILANADDQVVHGNADAVAS